MGVDLKEKGKMKRSWKICQYLLFLFGILLIIVGILIFLIVPYFVDNEIRKRAQLSVGSELLDRWVNPEFSIKSNIYIYSVENPDEILNGSKPIISTIGPYAYDIKIWHDVINSSNGIIKYKTNRKFTFNKNESCDDCSLQRKIWIPNIVFQKFVEAASNPSMSAAQIVLTSQTPFLEVAVNDMLFRGYKDPFLDKVCAMPFVNFVCDALLELPEKISFLGHKNGTDRGIFEALTGELDDGETRGQLLSWNGDTTVPINWWSGDKYAAKINGSDGSLYKPFIKKDDIIYVFVPDLCRSIYFVYEREINYKGVPGYRFIVPKKLFDWSEPENEPFCFNSGKSFFYENNEKCLPNGLIDISRCQKGEPPIVVSLPNFHYSDDIVKESIIGLNESTSDHDVIALEIEPQTGTVLKIERRSQINVAMWKGHDITIGADLSRMKSSIIPILSNYELFEIDDKTANFIIQKLINFNYNSSFVAVTSIIIGLFIIAIIFILFLRKSERILSYLQNRKKKITKVTISPISNDKPFSMDQIRGRYP